VFTPDIVTFEFPLLLSVTANKLLFPTLTFPKLTLVGLGDRILDPADCMLAVV